MEAIKIVEEWLTETSSRNLYSGDDVTVRLRYLSELIGGGNDAPEQMLIMNWLMTVDAKDLYISSKKLQNPLLDLWGLLDARREHASALAEPATV